MTAAMISIFIINGVYPGPLLLIKEPALINTIYFSLILINIVAFTLLIFFLKPFAMVVKIPHIYLSLGIMVLCLLGLYSLNLRIFDMGVALFMGIIGYIMLRLEWPFITWVLGMVLGPVIENRMRESLSLSEGNPLIFIKSPVSLIIFIATSLVIIIPIIVDRRQSNMQKR